MLEKSHVPTVMVDIFGHATSAVIQALHYCALMQHNNFPPSAVNNKPRSKTVNRYVITLICILTAYFGSRRPANSTPISFERSGPNLTVWISSTEAFSTPLPYGSAVVVNDTPESMSVLLEGYDYLGWLVINIKWNHPDIVVDDTFRWIPGGIITEFDGTQWNDIGTHRSFTYGPPILPDGGSVLVGLGLALGALSRFVRR